MSEATTEEMLAYLADRLDKIAEHPGGWGDPFAVECQYFMLIEFQWFLETGLRGVSPTRLWSGILHEHGYLSNVPLAHQEGLRDDQDKAFEELVRLLPLLRGYVPQECPDCHGGTVPCKTCHGKGHTFEKRVR
jgi:hypothetical protein